MITFRVVNFLVWLAIANANQEITDIDRYLDPFDPNPRFIVKNGHLMVMTGRNKDLVFRSSGSGRVKINGDDIAALKAGSSIVPSPITDQQGGDGAAAGGVVRTDLASQITELVNRRVEERMAGINATLEGRERTARLRRRQLTRLQRNFDKLERLLRKNECKPTNPCQNGGQCEDAFGAYICRCPAGFQGPNCNQDVDECERLQGTELGCQNGGTCLNTLGSFHCLCPANYQGVRCTVEFNDCRNASSHEICGSGECFDLPRTSSGVARYRCVCYQGFTKSVANSETAPCDADVNECATGVHRCSRSPPVACINTPAGYQCGSCPAGFSGDGYTCSPVDLCSVNNGGCSLSPRVSCYSHQSGRVVCGPCPPGFQGDGTTCTQLDGDICSSNNGGCSPQARCVANTAISATYRDCLCPPGTTGSGIGPSGCAQVTGDSSSMSCDSRPCQNGGTCIPYRGGVYCSCPQNFNGTFCEHHQVNACSSNPCLNGGACVNVAYGYSCICTKQYNGQNCDRPRAKCSYETLDFEAGILAYPITANDTSDNGGITLCSWTIKNSKAAGRVLNITFTKFSLGQEMCNYSRRSLRTNTHLTLFDGFSTGHRRLGPFCGSKRYDANFNFISTFNVVLVRLQIDPSTSAGYNKFFELNWLTTDRGCGGLITEKTHGRIDSPPASRRRIPPGTPLDCRWEMIGDYGQRFQFVFNHLQIPAAAGRGNCPNYLELREGIMQGTEENSTVNSIMRFCNWTSSPELSVPPPITSSLNFVTVVYRSVAGNLHGNGFQMLFNQVPGACGGLLSTSSGTISPPMRTTAGDELVYASNTACDWLIRALPSERISLRFLNFNLEDDHSSSVGWQNSARPKNRKCLHDYVMLMDGQESSSPLMARLCGAILPPAYISSGRYLRVRWKSDGSIEHSGFTAEFKSICGNEIEVTTTPGIFQSPGYPTPLDKSKNCSYTLVAASGYLVKLTIDEMDIELDAKCRYDYLLINKQRYCGDHPPPPIFSMSSELRVDLITDRSRPSKGFSAHFEAVEVGCGGTHKQGQPLVAITPEHIRDEPFIQRCFWEIQSSNASYIVTLKFQHMETAAASSGMRTAARRRMPCSQRTSNYLLVNDTDGTLITRFCPDQLPPTISSTGTKLFITYVLRIPLRSTPLPTPSTTTTTTTTTSPTTAASRTTTVQVSGNGTSTPIRSSTSIAALNMNQILRSFDRLMDRVAPQLSPLPPVEERSFYANYFFVKENNYCDKNLFANSGSIRSPNFPRQYKPGLNCTFIVHVDNGQQIKLNVTTFDIEGPGRENGNCYDYVEIRNGRRADSPLIGKFCGKTRLPDIISHSNYLFIRFITDQSTEFKGFEIKYESIGMGCGGLLTADTGIIESPDYPNAYQTSAVCSYLIRVAEGSAVLLYIVDMNLEVHRGGSCRFDYIELFDGADEGARLLGKVCSTDNDDHQIVFTSSSNKMFIKFTSDDTINQGGFKLKFRTLCNRTLSGFHGVIESPNYPNPHSENLNCQYHILGPMGNNLTVSFTSLNLERGVDRYGQLNCQYDFVNISQVNRYQQLSLDQVDLTASPHYHSTINGSRIFCGNFSDNPPTPLQFTSNEILIAFRSDQSISVGSWRLEWGAVGCGGSFLGGRRQKTVITSPNYPSSYPYSTECIWFIQAPEGHSVDLLVENLELEQTYGPCRYDYLSVLGGADLNSTELTRLCSQSSGTHVSSIGNHMVVKFVADGSTSRKGFKASFTTLNPGCGGKYTAEEGTLVSPSYGRGGTYDRHADCTYLIQTGSHSDIQLTINDLNIPSRLADCSSGFLAVYDSSSQQEGKLLGKFCNRKPPVNYVLNSTNSALFLRFKADSEGSTGRGFNITYKSVCGRTITLSEEEASEGYQTITSPNYPHKPRDTEPCRFVLKSANPSAIVSIQLTHVQLYGYNYHVKVGNFCLSSYINLYEGAVELPEKRLRHFCDNDIPLPVVSKGNSLLLVSYFAIFRAVVSSVQSFCGADLTALEGFIASPGYPNSYPLSIECIWRLEASFSNRYLLEFEDFELEENDFCNGDYLEIRQGSSSGPLLGGRRLCGVGKDNLPSLASTIPGDTWIKFKTDDRTVAKGFLLHFKLATNVMLSGESGQIASPGFPKDFHAVNRSFTYSIVVEQNQFIKFTVKELNLDDGYLHYNCPVKLLFYEGILDTSRLDASSLEQQSLPQPKVRLCASVLPAPFASEGNAVTVVFSGPPESNVLVKYSLKWESINRTELAQFDEHREGVPGGVNSTFNLFAGEMGEAVSLVDGNYSQFLGEMGSSSGGGGINWYVRTHSWAHFNLSWTGVRFPTTDCWQTRFRVYAWTGAKFAFVRNICAGATFRPVELSASNLLRIHLDFSNLLLYTSPIALSSSQSPSIHFNLTLVPVCGGNFTSSSDTINSEEVTGWSGALRGSTCRWLVKVRPGRTIQFTVDYYSIGYCHTASKESLRIFNGQSESSPLLVPPMCGVNTSSVTLPMTAGNLAYLVFKAATDKDKFRLRYREVGLECGGELVLHSLRDVISVTSPGYPATKSVHHEVMCDFIVRGPVNAGLQVSFATESWAPCDKTAAHLKIYEGGTDMSPLSATYCVPPGVTTGAQVNSHIALLRYVVRPKSGQSLAARFNATIRPLSCFREVFVSNREGQMKLLPFNKTDASSAVASAADGNECSLHLRTFPSHRITVNITSMYLQGSNCSVGDMITLHNSPYETYTIRRYCGPRNRSAINYSIVSTKNELFIAFKRSNFQGNASQAANRPKVGITFSVAASYLDNVKVIDGTVRPRGTIRFYATTSISEEFYKVFRLFGEPGTRFKLHFERFSLGQTPFNLSDFKCPKTLNILLNIYYQQHSMIKLGCSSEMPADIITPNHLVSISFEAKELAPREGFSLSYKMIYDNESCSALLDSPRGQLISSNYNNLNYTGIISCAWVFSSLHVNQSFTLVLSDFDVPSDCANQTLSIVPVLKTKHFNVNSRVNTCIRKEVAPQTKGTKYVLPVFWRRTAVGPPTVLFSFNRTEVGQWRGLKGEWYLQNCGGHFVNAFEQEFTSPNYPADYGTDVFCNYFLQLSSDGFNANGYRLVFTEFDIGNSCEEDYFLITKPRFEPPVKEKICRQDGPPQPIVVGHSIYLTFVSSRNLSLTSTSSTSPPSVSRKFKFRLERATEGCGGMLLSPSGSFSSPNYVKPNDQSALGNVKGKSYPNSIECVWQIKAVPDFHLQFNFSSRFDLEDSTNCSNDFLRFEERHIDFVDDSEVERWRLLSQVCGPHTPAMVVSSTDTVRVTFRTNEAVTADGFFVDYTQVCGGLFQEASGTISSPHYSEGFYGSQLKCVFKIQRSPHEYIRLRFEDFSLEGSPVGQCNYDRVTIVLGESTNKSALTYGPYCGDVLPPQITAHEKVSVVFETDYSVTKRGFRFHYSVSQCGGNITDSSRGIIVSPELNEDRSSLTCKWVITVPEAGNSVAIRILELNVISHLYCESSLKIFNGVYDRKSAYQNLLAHICTNASSDATELTFKSTNNSISVVYSTYRPYYGRSRNEEPSYIRFKLEYYSTPGPKAGCGGRVSAAAGEGGGGAQVVSSPDTDGDSNYEPDLSCVWAIAADSLDSVVQLQFERFDVDPGSGNSSSTSNDCSDGDYLEVFDGTTMRAPPLARLCGRERLPEQLQSTGESMLLHFVSNGDNATGHGFRARYVAFNQSCGSRHLVAKEGRQEISSPNYPSPYTESSPQTCTWSFARAGMQPTVLTFLELDLNCSRGDYLQLMETSGVGDDSSSSPLRPLTLCRSPSQVKIVSYRPLRLVMQSFTEVHSTIAYDTSVATVSRKALYKGFRLTYHSSLCNETLSGADNGYAFNKYYPRAERFNHDYLCIINISVPADRQIALHFSAFSFGLCHYRNISIYEGGGNSSSSNSKAKATFCNSQQPPYPVFSTGSSLSVVIRASAMPSTLDNQIRYRNMPFLYAFNYYASLRGASASGAAPGCGGNLTGQSGVFSSPLYPQVRLEGEDRVCSWLIHSNGYHTLTLTFTFLQLAPGCGQNRVIVYDADEPLEEKQRVTLCAFDQPAPIRSESSTLLVQMIVTKDSYNGGFLAKFKMNLEKPKSSLRVVSSETSAYIRTTFRKTNTFTFF